MYVRAGRLNLGLLKWITRQLGLYLPNNPSDLDGFNVKIFQAALKLHDVIDLIF